MDTATHFIIGVSLAGLAQIDPIVQQQPLLSQAILIGTIVGSQAPDFDGITRMFGGTSTYIRNHRGLTHSLPFLLIWPTLLSYLIQFFYTDIPLFHLWLWTFFAVCFHIFLDVFNAYGTQALRPFSEKWIALNIINIFDPFIFSIHTMGVVLWITNFWQPLKIFPVVYLLTFIYMGWRYMTHHTLLQKLKLEKKLSEKLTLLPTIRQNVWNMIEEQTNQYRLGILRGTQIEWVDKKQKLPDHPCIQAAKNDQKAQNFLYFTKYAYPEWHQTDKGYVVKWIDLRYRFRDHYPFMVVVALDDSFQIMNSFIGWAYTEKHLDKRINSLHS